MPLSNPLFSGNARIRRAAENAPPMRRGESDAEAVKILQNALVAVGAGTMRRSLQADGTLDGDYGGETVNAVKRFQEANQLGGARRRGDGIAGRRTWEVLDRLAPHEPVAMDLTPHGPTVTPPAETPATTDTSRTPGLPTAAALEAEYRTFRALQGRPCPQQRVIHQCAVRMSVALAHCAPNFHLDNPDLRFTHGDGAARCRLSTPHNTGAQRLFDHLRTFWTFTHYRKGNRGGMTAAAIRRAANVPGIIFFQNLNGAARDHIDYWDGTHTMNDLLDYNAPDERDPGATINWDRWFEQAERNIWFLSL